jgi:hypothetical protein
MSIEKANQNSIETANTMESAERGSNVTVSIDLIRHPEKDENTGKLTEGGKEKFFEELREDFGAKEDYDTVKFYVSPLSRGQESKEPISNFLEVSSINTTIRDKAELAGLATEIGPTFKEEMTAILEQEELLTRDEIEKAREKDTSIPAHEPASKDFETNTNEVLIRDFFDKDFPGSNFSGGDMAEVVNGLIEHFARLASRLKSESKVKLVLVGHSGVIEHLTKYVYLQNHPELTPEEVDVKEIGGLIDFSEGPEIAIVSDGSGAQSVKFSFKDLELDYNINVTT